MAGFLRIPCIDDAAIPESVIYNCKRIYEEIINTAFNNDNYNVVRLMKQLVPEYKSQNSIYESIDKEMNR